jgi:hypothetical protein
VVSAVSNGSGGSRASRASNASSSNLFKPTTSSQRRRQSFGIALQDDPTQTAGTPTDVLMALSVDDVGNMSGSSDGIGGGIASLSMKQIQVHDSQLSDSSTARQSTVQLQLPEQSASPTKMLPRTLTRSYSMFTAVTEATNFQGSSSLRSSAKKPYGTQQFSRTAEILREMQEDPRYSKWHPRYRIPQPVYGLSKPFFQRPDGAFPKHAEYKQLHDIDPENRDNTHIKNADLSYHTSIIEATSTPQTLRITGFTKAVAQMRDSFEKLPPRNTIPRAHRGLPPQFYPMDYDNFEALRRSGHFNDSIGVSMGVSIHGKPCSGLGLY